MIVEINKNGTVVISDIVGGYLITKQFIGYTKKEAVKQFNRYRKEAK